MPQSNVPSNISFERLEEQLNWYDTRSAYNQRMFKWLRTATIGLSVSIPLAAGFLKQTWVAGGLGALIALCEGVQQLNQYHHNWITYRSTAEALKHEKYLFLATAGHYASVENPNRLLAERVESLVSQEHAKWSLAREQVEKEKEDKK
jgi:uncharacterized protein DUF4231